MENITKLIFIGGPKDGCVVDTDVETPPTIIDGTSQTFLGDSAYVLTTTSRLKKEAVYFSAKMNEIEIDEE